MGGLEVGWPWVERGQSRSGGVGSGGVWGGEQSFSHGVGSRFGEADSFGLEEQGCIRFFTPLLLHLAPRISGLEQGVPGPGPRPQAALCTRFAVVRSFFLSNPERHLAALSSTSF